MLVLTWPVCESHQLPKMSLFFRKLGGQLSSRKGAYTPVIDVSSRLQIEPARDEALLELVENALRLSKTDWAEGSLLHWEPFSKVK